MLVAPSLEGAQTRLLVPFVCFVCGRMAFVVRCVRVPCRLSIGRHERTNSWSTTRVYGRPIVRLNSSRRLARPLLAGYGSYFKRRVTGKHSDSRSSFSAVLPSVDVDMA